MARAGGNPGNKGGGRPKEHDAQIRKFKGVAWDLIIKRCTDRNQEKSEKWLDVYIPMFASKLMPQEIAGTGENGAILMEIKDSQYANIVKREALKING